MAQITKFLDQSIVDIYISMFENHTDHIRRHQAGVDEWKSVFPTSVIEPRTTWTPEEKSAFFRGLAIYSRLRPDLIAESICHAGGQKSAADVGAYIAVLERASRQKGRPSDWRANMPAARVLTKRWRLFEEECADMLLMGEAAAERQAVEERRQAQLKDARLGGAPLSFKVDATVERALKRKRKDDDASNDTLSSDTESGGCSGSSYGRKITDEAGRHCAESGERTVKRRNLQEQWMREDILRNLDYTRVAALQTIYRHHSKHGGNCSPGGWITPMGRLALNLGYTPDALERDGITLIDWYALWKSTARLKWAFMDSRLQYRTPSGVTTLLSTEGTPYTMKRGGAIQYRTLQLLNAYVKSYITAVIHRAIVLKERFVNDRPWEALQRYERELSGDDMRKDRSGSNWLDQQCIFKAIELVGKPRAPVKVFRFEVDQRLHLDLDVWPEELATKGKRKARETAPGQIKTAATGDLTADIDEDETQATDEVGTNTVDENGTGEQLVKRKRGRPRKHPINVDTTLKPKRPRGRPPLPRDHLTGEKIRPLKIMTEDVDMEIGLAGTTNPERPSPAPVGLHSSALAGMSASVVAAAASSVDVNFPPKRGRNHSQQYPTEQQEQEVLLPNIQRNDNYVAATVGSTGADGGNIRTITVTSLYPSTKEKAKLREPPWAEPRNIVVLPRSRSRAPSRTARILVEPKDSISECDDGGDYGSSGRDVPRSSDFDARSWEEADTEDELSEADHAKDVEYEELLWGQFGLSYEEPDMLENERDFTIDNEQLGVRGSFVKSKPFIVSEDEEDFVTRSDSDYVNDPR